MKSIKETILVRYTRYERSKLYTLLEIKGKQICDIRAKWRNPTFLSCNLADKGYLAIYKDGQLGTYRTREECLYIGSLSKIKAISVDALDKLLNGTSNNYESW